MKILNLVFNIFEFLLACLGLWFVVLCLSAAFADTGCLKINGMTFGKSCFE